MSTDEGRTLSPYVVLEPSREWGPLRALPSTVLGWLLKAYRLLI